MELALQVFIDGNWERAAALEFLEPTLGPAGACNFEYDFDYLTRWVGKDVPLAAVSLRLPIGFGPSCGRRWPAFLDDLRPMGAAHRWWLRRLDLPAGAASELEILRRGTIAPVGNLRIEEAVPPKDQPPLRFPKQQVVDREHGFLDHAADHGAQVGGATGAGGDGPKVLLRLNDANEVWIDAWQDEPTNPDRHYLVKFARSARERDRVILRSEHVYYRALAALEVETIPVEGMSLEEGPGGPSLWLPRFDVARRGGHEVRWGLESIYSLLGSEPGAYLTHQKALSALREVMAPEGWRELLLEYLRRDLLNLVFGNSDNHGRNLAVLKTDTRVRLAPVYDFAPMKMDLEGITRTTRWEGFESGGSVDWPALLKSFGQQEEYLRAGLRELAIRLQELPDLLMSLGLPEETLRFPSLGLQTTAQKLRGWTLL